MIIMYLYSTFFINKLKSISYLAHITPFPARESSLNPQMINPLLPLHRFLLCPYFPSLRGYTPLLRIRRRICTSLAARRGVD